MAKTLLEQKSKEVKVLDETTRELLASIEHKDRRRRQWGTLAFCALLTATGIGIWATYDQGVIGRQHTDCIIKDLTTPIPPDAKSKYIDIHSRLTADCKIKFVK